jgi:hypothetical protein
VENVSACHQGRRVQKSIDWMAKKDGPGAKAQVSASRMPTASSLDHEVGAVRTDNYRTCAPWMDVTVIDLHSRHPSILKQYFLLTDHW